MPSIQVKVDFSNGTIRIGSTIEDRHIRSVPPARATRAIKYIAPFAHHSPHGVFIWLSIDPADEIKQPVVERAASIHLEIDPAVQPLDHFKHLGSPVVDDQVIGTQTCQLRMR